MQLLRYLGAFFGVIVLSLFVYAAFLPSRFSLQKSIEISRKPHQVYQIVSNFNEWKKWSPWYEMDPTADYLVDGGPSEVGSRISWKSQKIGTGSLVIQETNPPLSFRAKLHFEEPREMEAYDIWRLEPLERTTRIVWIHEANLSYPFERLMASDLQNMLTPQLERGLSNLKMVVETTTDP